MTLIGVTLRAENEEAIEIGTTIITRIPSIMTRALKENVTALTVTLVGMTKETDVLHGEVTRRFEGLNGLAFGATTSKVETQEARMETTLIRKEVGVTLRSLATST